MAVPKPNYTQTPNRFIDEYMNQVSPAATKIYLTICRKTIGWHKDTEDISLSQIMKLTGLSKNTALRATEELEGFDLIIVTRKGSGRRATNNYELNFECINEPEKSMGNGSNSEPINPVNGSNSEPINPVNGSNSEHTKEILIKKESKEIQEPAGSAPETPFNAIDIIFKKGSEKRTGQPYYRDAKEAKQIKLLEPRYTRNPELFKKHVLKYYYIITEIDDPFWRTQPFTPSAFNSHYNRILNFKLPKQFIEQERRKNMTDDDLLFERFGKYNEDELKYAVRVNMITQDDFNMIMKRKLPEAV